MKIIKWIDEDTAYNNEYDNYDSIGTLGGFFKNGMRWKDYIKNVNKDIHSYVELMRKDIVKNKLRYTGQQVNYSHVDGVPVFSDKKLGFFSWRAWGDLMAATWSEEENKDYNYMNFYM